MNFRGMYARLALKKEPEVALFDAGDLAGAVYRANEAISRFGVSFEDARNMVASASFDYVQCGVVRDDGSHGFGSLHGFRSGYRRNPNPYFERGWLRCGVSGPWLQEFGGVS